ncbi:MAG: iron-sulfur cluster co-chaperone HscB C-terminal domain-containing protein [Limnohabitans sp.]
MHWRESLEDTDELGELEGLAVEVAAEHQRLLLSLGQLLDGGGNSQAAVGLVRALMFIERFAAELDTKLDRLQGFHTRNDSPQPQRSRSLGLLKRKPSLRPSRTKSSSVPSM